jgi:hypothetical protein
VKKLTVTLATLLVALGACQNSPNDVVDKVLVDFGLRAKPDDYVTGSDRVMDRLAQVGKVEMNRLNARAREGEVKFQEGEGLSGKYYKEVKKYEVARPADAQGTSKPTDSNRGYVGYISYEYRVYQSERRNTRAEAAALDADIPTDIRGRDLYRYNFTSGGTWNGGEGELVKR